MTKLFTVDDCEELTLQEVKKLYKDHVNPALTTILSNLGTSEELIEYAEGSWMYSRSGKKILDATGGMGVLNIGHNHPRILKARIKFQEMKRMEVHKTIFSPYLAALSHNLAQVLKNDLKYPFFCNSGAEAVEGAMKIAYKYHEGKRKYILHSDIAYHGKLLGSGSITSSKLLSYSFPKIPFTAKFKYNSIESIKYQVENLRKENGKSDIYAIIVEPFSASTLNCCSNQFLEDLRLICDKEKIVLIFDEIFSGWYKTGNLFYFMNSNASPDILTVSKALGGGKASISAYITKSIIIQKAYGNINDALLHSTTYNGFGEECITAIEAINILVEEGYHDKAKLAEHVIRNRLEKLTTTFPDQVETYLGAGTLFGIILKTKSNVITNSFKKIPEAVINDDTFFTKVSYAAFTEYLFKEYNIYTVFNERVIWLSPPLNIKEEEIHYFFNCFENTLKVGLLKLTTKFIKNRLVNIFK